jgi:hypothetical protein
VPASFRPKVVGSAWMPWLRPTSGVNLCSLRAGLQRGQHPVDIADQDVGGAGQLHGEAGVQHVRAGHALVQEAGFLTDDFGHMGQEGDDVVLGGALDLVDPVGVEDRVAALGPDRLGGIGSGMVPSSAILVAACASISNQILYLVSCDQMATIGAGIARDHGCAVSVSWPRESTGALSGSAISGLFPRLHTRLEPACESTRSDLRRCGGERGDGPDGRRGAGEGDPTVRPVATGHDRCRHARPGAAA